MRAYECAITVRDEPELVERVFLAEEKEFKHGRSEYLLKREKGALVIICSADDPTALRATVTSVTRILNIVKQTRDEV
ncbi:hypothetical protein GOV10_04385 [Candidatus Woesearchaeota archaeon]|nr:hypothetical protein [Candidatus Woesearchaeota archaeon]